jgi:hypothetical protein
MWFLTVVLFFGFSLGSLVLVFLGWIWIFFSLVFLLFEVLVGFSDIRIFWFGFSFGLDLLVFLRIPGFFVGLVFS